MLAIVCSGQGHQHRDMFRLTADAAPAAAIFAAAQFVLGEDPRAFVASAPPASMHANRTAQILCVTQALAAATMFDQAFGTPRLIAGYSVGELAAWSVGGALLPETIPALAARRAEIMDAAGAPGDGLAFVRGLNEREVQRLCTAHDVHPAITNPGLVFVIGGAGDALDRFILAARQAGAARADRLDVNTASHTPCLAGAMAPFGDALRAAGLHRLHPGTTLVSALDGTRIVDPARQAESLAQQLANTLHWDQCLDALIERGASAVLELGPGRALADMVTGLRPDLPARSIDDFHEADGLRAWLAARV